MNPKFLEELRENISETLQKVPLIVGETAPATLYDDIWRWMKSTPN